MGAGVGSHWQITAAIGADGTVGQTSSVWNDDGGTRNAALVLVRTGM
jgi:hypothetical protein